MIVVKDLFIKYIRQEILNFGQNNDKLNRLSHDLAYTVHNILNRIYYT